MKKHSDRTPNLRLIDGDPNALAEKIIEAACRGELDELEALAARCTQRASLHLLDKPRDDGTRMT